MTGLWDLSTEIQQINPENPKPWLDPQPSEGGVAERLMNERDGDEDYRQLYRKTPSLSPGLSLSCWTNVMCLLSPKSSELTPPPVWRQKMC